MDLKTQLKDKDLIEAFKAAFEASRFDSAAAFLRHVIKSYVLKNPSKKNQNEQPLKPLDENDLIQMKAATHIPAFLKRGLEKRAKDLSVKPAVYLRNLIAANLTQRPVMTEPQIVELRAANRELAAIGRNLNQIAKAMNQAVDLKVRDRVNYDHIVELQAGIEKQKAAIYKIVAQSNNVWRVE